MMKILFLFALFFQASFVGAVGRQSIRKSCELSVSRKAKVLSRLIQIGLERNFFTQEEIGDFFASKELYNPYTRFAKSVDSLSLRNGFEKTSLGVTPEEVAALKKSLAAVIEINRDLEKTVAVAKKETEQIFAPKVLGQIEIPEYPIRSAPLDLTWHDGRPLFVTLVDDLQKLDSTTIVVVDPFNSQVEKRVTGVPRTSGAANARVKFEFFERNGIPYAVDFPQNFYIDLNTNKNVASSVFRRSYNTSLSSSVESAIVKGPGFVKVVSIAKRGEFENLLIVGDLLAPRSKPKILEGNVPHMRRPPVAHYVDNKAYVTYSSSEFIYIYDASDDQRLEPIPAQLGWDRLNDVIIYSNNGAHFAALSEQDPRTKKMQIRIIDLETRTETLVREKFKAIEDLGFVLFDGVPHLHFFADGNLNVLNLRSRKVDRNPVPSYGPISRFTWSGRDFLIWTPSRGDLLIFDLGSRTLYSLANLLPWEAHQVTPFEYRGQIYALVAVANKMPHLLRLTSGGESDGEAP